MIDPYYQEDGITIYNGDCLEVMRELPANSIDTIITDPPYGTTACKWDSIIPLEQMWKHIKRVRKDNSAIALFGSEPFSSFLRISNIKEYKYDWVWDKVAGANFFNLINRPFKTHEIISIFSKVANFTFNPIRVFRTVESLKRHQVGNNGSQRNGYKEVIEHYGISIIRNSLLAIDGKKHPIDIIKFSGFEEGRYNFRHPTKKPLKLLKYLVKTYTDKEQFILDFTMGSGTTLVAAKELGRQAIGIELEKEYCDIAIDRLRQGVLGL